MAQVPASYIKAKPVDFPGEIFACLGSPSRRFGLDLPPPSLATFALLESWDCPVVHKPDEATVPDYLMAAYVCSNPRRAAPAVQKYAELGEHRTDALKDEATYPDLLLQACWTIDVSSVEPADLPLFRRWLLNVAFEGYEMIPSLGGGREWVFGAETMAAACRAFPGLPPATVLWDLPLCLIGHVIASEARANGCKGVSRPKDPADIKLQIALANAREAAGELHPWQVERPDLYGLDATQVAVRPAIKDDYNAALKTYLRAKREKAAAHV